MKKVLAALTASLMIATGCTIDLETKLQKNTKTEPFKKIYEIHAPYVPESQEEISQNKDVAEYKIKVDHSQGSKEVNIKIPLFTKLNCNTCHTVKELADKTKARLEKGIQTINSQYPDTFKNEDLIPKLYVIQPYEIPSEDAFAYTIKPERSINIKATSILFEKQYMNDSITAHEQMHLGQGYLWLNTETEPHFLNISNSDGRTWANTRLITYDRIISTFIDNTLEKEIYKYYNNIDELNLIGGIGISDMPKDLETKIKKTIEKLKPIFAESAKERSKNPLGWEYHYRDLAVETLLPEIIAAKNLKPIKKISKEKLNKGLETIRNMYYSDADNPFSIFGIRASLRRGFDMQAMNRLSDEGFSEEEARIIYFSYLKERFVNKDGSLNLGDMPYLNEVTDERLYFMEEHKKMPIITEEGRKFIDQAIQDLEKKLSPGYKRKY
ncbi:MAG: hypothetical protein Q8N77_03835 [Nanoarchaeota archaeon]|nr:hypothetical protein [Nanoarchaeota archaeon]